MEISYFNLIKLNRFLFISEPPSQSPSDINLLLQTIIVHLKEWAVAVYNLFLSLLDNLNRAFPPETRPKWLNAAAPYVIAVAAVLFLLVLLYCCVVPLLTWLLFTCWRICRCLCGKLCCCRRRRRRRRWDMMTAPGTLGQSMIVRSEFEADPRVYFRSLRAGTLPVTHRLR